MHESLRHIAATAAFVMTVGAGIQAASADGLLTTHRVSAAAANEAVGAAVAACAAQGYFVTAVLVDSDGLRQAVLRGDNAGPHTLDGAQFKAFTSVTTKSDSGAFAKRFENATIPNLFIKMPQLVLAQGAILLKSGDEVIGGLGVSGAPGGEKDEACARAGWDKVADRMK
jgi:uncharacterized protein GlcG (DUF336 family)